MTARPLTKAEMRSALVETFEHIAEEWARYPDKTKREVALGVVHSILVTLDGQTDSTPPFELVPMGSGDAAEGRAEEEREWWPVLPSADREIVERHSISENCMLHDLMRRTK